MCESHSAVCESRCVGARVAVWNYCCHHQLITSVCTGLVMATPQLARPNKRQRCSETDSPGTYIYACVIYLAA